MGGSEVSNHETWTLVLLGRTGNGKSATGNSILGRKAFQTKFSSFGFTRTCELHSAQLDDELTIDVIDTPGLFDLSSDPKIVSKEIFKCVELAKDGIHAVLLVLSVRTRFSKEELAALEFFGRKICDYMIVIFTGGDELEDSDETLEGYLDHCPEPLKDTLALCEGRLVLFDNKSKDPKKKADQLQELLSKVNLVLQKNGHLPYTNEMFMLFKGLKVDSSTSDSNPSSYNEQLIRLTEMMVDNTRIMYELFAKEQLARLQAEQVSKEAQMRSEAELRELRKAEEARKKQEAEEARKKQEAEEEAEEARKKKASESGGCNIL